MGRIRIASQLPAGVNALLAAGHDDVEFLEIPRGLIAALPGDVAILLGAPLAAAGDPPPPHPPAGWPFGLRWIYLPSAGLDYYPAWLFRGPVVTSGAGTSAVPVAEFAFAAIMAAAKRLPEIWIDDAVRWDRTLRLGSVAGATLGIVGFGAIGRAVAAMALALGMKVQALRRSAAPFDLPGVARSPDLGRLFETSDHVVLAAPGDAANRHMIDAAILDRAKPGLHLVNVARGLLIDDDALLAALESGRVSRATLDVCFPEPLPPGHAYYAHPKVFLSPHIAFNTPATLREIAAQFAANLARFRAGIALDGVVTC